ncbi:MAG: xanthine dehydrogenase family protein subunit M, partial [Acidimicrobiia bacterium]|nr:xanthine dehydrogenase family protein subunit M [Acidimicrobiia bacterium]
MHPRSFEYLAPGSLDEACAILAEDEWAKVMSGGMSLIPMMKLRLLSPPTVVDIGRIPGLDYVEDRGDHVAIGALTTHAVIAEHPLIAEHANALGQASRWTGDVQVRNRGTLCGTIAHADLAADTPVAALALGATMVATSSRGERLIDADGFFVDTLQSDLAPDEILTEVRIPTRAGGSAYDKLGRRGGHTDYAVAGVSVWVADADGTDARVAVTGIGTK